MGLAVRVAEPRWPTEGGAAPSFWRLPFVSALAAPLERVLAGMVAAGLGIEAILLYLGLPRAALDDALAWFAIATPHDGPLRRRGGRNAWLVADTMRLVAWRVSGIHPATIGARLGRSANSVRAKSRRLGLPTPPRGSLRRADPRSLADPPGLPVEWAVGPRAAPTACPRPAAPTPSPGRPSSPCPGPGAGRPAGIRIVPAAAEDVAAASADTRVAASKQRELQLFRVLPAVATTATTTATGSAKEPAVRLPGTPDLALQHSVARSAGIDPVGAVPLRPVRRGRAPDSDKIIPELAWIAGVRHLARDREAVLALSRRHFGLEHWRTTAEKAGISTAIYRTLRTRIDLPLDGDRSKFGDWYDDDLAERNLAGCGYELKREVNGMWFWRRKGSGDLVSMSTRLRTGAIDKDDRDRFRARVDLVSSRSQPASLGLSYEKPASGRGAPAIRPGLPGVVGQQMSWA